MSSENGHAKGNFIVIYINTKLANDGVYITKIGSKVYYRLNVCVGPMQPYSRKRKHCCWKSEITARKKLV